MPLARSNAAAVLLLNVSLVLLAAVTPPAAAAQKGPSINGLHNLKIGDAAPDFSLPGIDGKTHTLADYKDARLLLIVFISNHCPDSHAAQGRILKLAAEMKGRGLAVVAINPNNPEGLSINELGYTQYGDGFEDMKKYAAESGAHGSLPLRRPETGHGPGLRLPGHAARVSLRRPAEAALQGLFRRLAFRRGRPRSSRSDARNAVEALGGQARAGRGDQAARLLDEVGRQEGAGRGDRREMGQDAGGGGADRRRGGGRAPQKWHPEGAAVQRLGDLVRALPGGVSGVGQDARGNSAPALSSSSPSASTTPRTPPRRRPFWRSRAPACWSG